MRTKMALANLLNHGALAKPGRALRLVAALGFFLGPVIATTAAPAAANAAKPVAAEIAPSAVQAGRAVPSSGDASEAQTYEAREAQSKSLEQFKGGDTVVIAGSTLVLVLLVVLLIVLI